MSKIKHFYTMRTHDHSGWTDEEDELLFSAVADAKRSSRPLRSAFDVVALSTGRRPNSIRNYYYLRIRDDDIIQRYSPCKAQSFVPFSDDEVRMLLRRILTDQANGISVRSSTMSLAKGDMTDMLRYQNKYRSLLKTEPVLITEVANDLKKEGLPSFNPYSDTPVHKSGRPRKEAVSARESRIQQAIDSLYNVDGLNVESLFECLGALAESAGQAAAIRNENTQLRERIKEQDAELAIKSNEILAVASASRNITGAGRSFSDAAG